MKAGSTKPVEEIELLRGGEVVTSFAGALGRSLRETRLTAMLGYLAALKPEPFVKRFGFRGKPLSITLEARHEEDRSDILLQTTDGVGIVEAKVDAVDPLRQSFKYKADWRVLLTQWLPPAKRRQLRGVKYLRWQDIVGLLEELAASTNPKARFLARDLLRHLEEHQMTKNEQKTEVYARDVNEEETLGLFLKARMYSCQFKVSSPLPQMRYFAPCFGQAVADLHPGVQIGISYVARIDQIEVVERFEDFLKVVNTLHGKAWLRQHRRFVEPMRHREWRSRRSILFLGPPRLVFNPAIRKEHLQRGHGWLSKQFYSFDQLFEAWGC
jgi:hypothetical protein